MSDAKIVPANQRMKDLKVLLDKRKGSLSAVAAKMIRPETLVSVAISAAQSNPKLLECSPDSIFRCLLQSAELGLMAGSALNQAFLVPYKGNAQLIVSATGLCELAYRTGMVADVTAEAVFKGDVFEYELGLNPILRHIPRAESIDPNDITHVYAVVSLTNGHKKFKIMSRAEVLRIQGMSRSAGFGPWVDHWAEMAKKTVVRAVLKYVPKSVEVARAIALDNAHDTGNYALAEFDTPEAQFEQEERPSAVSKLASKVEKVVSENPGALDLEEIARKEALEQVCFEYNTTYQEAFDRAKKKNVVFNEAFIRVEYGR